MNYRNKILFVFILCSVQFLAQTNYRTEINVNGKYFENRDFSVDVIKDDKPFYSITKKLLPHFSIPETKVLANGNLIFLHSLEGIIEIYSSNKNLIFEKSFYQLPSHREQAIKFSSNNFGFAVFVSEEQKNKIFTISNSGIISDSIKVENGFVAGISISDENNFIAYSIYNWNDQDLLESSTLLNLKTNDQFSIPIKFENGKFNIKQNLFLGFTNKNSFCVDLINKNILWQNKLDGNEIFVDADFNDVNSIFIKSLNPKYENRNWIYKNYKTVEFDLNGNEKLLSEFHQDAKELRFTKTKTGIELNIDGKNFSIK